MDNHAASIKARYERSATLFRKRPSSAISINELTVRVRHGLADEIEGCGYKLTGGVFQATDSSEEHLRPAFFGLAGLGLCLAHGYMMHFALRNVSVKGVEISLQTTIDKRAAFGVSNDAPPGYQGVKYHVEVESDAEREHIVDAIAAADSHSPWLYNFTQPLSVTRDVNIRQSQPLTAE